MKLFFFKHKIKNLFISQITKININFQGFYQIGQDFSKNTLNLSFLKLLSYIFLSLIIEQFIMEITENTVQFLTTDKNSYVNYQKLDNFKLFLPCLIDGRDLKKNFKSTSGRRII